jgi:hypothetical protein
VLSNGFSTLGDDDELAVKAGFQSVCQAVMSWFEEQGVRAGRVEMLEEGLSSAKRRIQNLKKEQGKGPSLG